MINAPDDKVSVVCADITDGHHLPVNSHDCPPKKNTANKTIFIVWTVLQDTPSVYLPKKRVSKAKRQANGDDGGIYTYVNILNFMLISV